MLSIKKVNYFITLIVVFILGTGICFGALTLTDTGKSLVSEDYEQFGRVKELEAYLKENYYEDITDEEISAGLNRGLFSSPGDPYTVYYTKEEFDEVNESAHGENSGIGVVMQGSKEDLIEIISLVKGGPAEAAGVKEGDKLISVDGEDFGGTQSAEAASKARGEAGTDVKIKVLRNGKEITFDITRDNFINPSVSSETIDGNIGYINVSTFNDNTAEDFRSALTEFEEQKVKGLIIDVRNNVGGIVSQGVGIADMLLDEAEIAYAENNKKEQEIYKTESGKTSLPYVLLVNGNSASTSEILAIGVKDNDGGDIVGEKTYGKGLIQSLQKFDRGDGARITVMQYFSASGKPINEVGVEPDYVVKMDTGAKKDIQLDKAKELLTD